MKKLGEENKEISKRLFRILTLSLTPLQMEKFLLEKGNQPYEMMKVVVEVSQ